MRRGVGAQHLLDGGAEGRVVATGLFDDARALRRRTFQRGFEDGPRLREHLGPAASGDARSLMARLTPYSGGSGGQYHPVRPTCGTHSRGGGDYRLAHPVASGDDRPATGCSPWCSPQLQQLAARLLRRERPDHTLEPNAVVNELYLRLIGSQPVSYQDRAHFFAIAAQTMRRILIDHARARVADKRGGDQRRVPLSDVEGWGAATSGEALLDLDTQLSALAAADPRAARVVELRFFGGLREEDVAEVLQCPSSRSNATGRPPAPGWRRASQPPVILADRGCRYTEQCDATEESPRWRAFQPREGLVSKSIFALLMC